jgi:hypothetical protein
MLRARTSRYIPTVLTTAETKEVIRNLSGVYHLLTILLYGSGLRLQEGYGTTQLPENTKTPVATGFGNMFFPH